MSESEMVYCEKCGEEYDWKSQDAPEGATIYWVPSCPVCGADMTCNPATEQWLEICSHTLSRMDEDEETEKVESYIEKIHYHARLVHGRLCGVSVEGLVDRAKEFDESSNQFAGSKGLGPRYYRDTAFRLRQQAREKVMG